LIHEKNKRKETKWIRNATISSNQPLALSALIIKRVNYNFLDNPWRFISFKLTISDVLQCYDIDYGRCRARAFLSTSDCNVSIELFRWQMKSSQLTPLDIAEISEISDALAEPRKSKSGSSRTGFISAVSTGDVFKKKEKKRKRELDKYD